MPNSGRGRLRSASFLAIPDKSSRLPDPSAVFSEKAKTIPTETFVPQKAKRTRVEKKQTIGWHYLNSRLRI